MGFFVTFLVFWFCSLIRLFLFLDFFGNFFCRNLLTFNTLVFLLSFCCCLLFHLKDFLWACLLSSIFSSWLRNTYGFIFLGFEKNSCASWQYVPCGQVFVSFYFLLTWPFPKRNLRPDECGLGSSGLSFALVFPNLNTKPSVYVSQGGLLYVVCIHWECM